MKTLDEILYEVLLFNVVERRALLLIPDKSPTQVYRTINHAIDMHYIREKTTVFYRNRKRYQYSFLTLTTEGIKYIISNEKMIDQYEWLNNIVFKSGKITILNTTDSSYSTKKSIQKYISLTTSAIFAKYCGAEVHPMYLDLLDYDSLQVIPSENGFTWASDSSIEDPLDDDPTDNDTADTENPELNKAVSENNETQIVADSPVKKKKRIAVNPLSKIIISAYKADKEYGSSKDYEKPNHLIYLNAIELKHIAVNALSSKYQEKPDPDLLTSIADVRRGRASGILRGPDKLIMMYVETSYGMQWSDRLLKGDMDARSQYIKHLKSQGIMSINEHFIEACLLVRNTEELIKNFYENINTKRKKDEDTDESESNKSNNKSSNNKPPTYDRIYVIPVNMDGVKHLKWLGTLDVQGHETENHDKLALPREKGGYGYEHLDKRIKDAGATIRLFDPNDEIPVFYGGLMDMKMLYNIRDAYTANKDLKLKVLCYKWQEEYYKALFPTIITVCNE